MKKFIIEVLKNIRDAFNYVKLFHKFKKVGKRCQILKPMRLRNLQNIELGDSCYFLPGVLMETLEEFHGQKFSPELKFGSNVNVGQNAHIFCADKITIGDNVFIGAMSMINDCTHGYFEKDVPFKDQELITAPIEIGDNTIIGISCLILPGVKIGKNCYIGGNTVISQDVPDYTIVSAPLPRKATIPY